MPEHRLVDRSQWPPLGKARRHNDGTDAISKERDRKVAELERSRDQWRAYAEEALLLLKQARGE
jgi:hypothetical protein